MVKAGPERFSNTIPWLIRPDAPVRHVVTKEDHPDGKKRDKFGNRLIVSHTKSYLDRAGNETRAALLVSKKGDTFLGQNPNIIDNIEHGVYVLQNAASNREIDLGNNRSMKRVRSHAHAQSKLFLLETNDKKYMIKTPATVEARHKNFRQPYINEMLQSQTLAADLDKILSQAQIEMPTFMFASGQMSCTEYIEGVKPDGAYLLQKIKPIAEIIEEFIQSQQNDLWNNIYQDAFTRIGSELHLLRPDNFVQRVDGTLVWVDPFKYDESPVLFDANIFSPIPPLSPVS